MLAQLLQRSTVVTQGDYTGLRETLGMGLTKGVSSSLGLFNIIMDTLICIVKEALTVLQRDSGSCDFISLLAFANVVVIQSERDFEAAIAL